MHLSICRQPSLSDRLSEIFGFDDNGKSDGDLHAFIESDVRYWGFSLRVKSVCSGQICRDPRGIPLLPYLIVIFLCQLFGEALVAVLDLPVPGPVIGMALLFVGLLIKGGIPEGLGKVGDTLLSHLSLLFIPAGVGVIAQIDLLKREILPLSVSLVVSTFVAIAVTGVLMSWLSKAKKPEQSS